MLFLSWRSVEKTKTKTPSNPAGPDGVVRLTETGKTLAGLAVVVAAFGALSWIALTLAQA